jgi:Xaa-Pro aminopeptidase
MRYNSIEKEFFVKNRDRLTKELLSNSIALIYGSHQMPRNGDQFFPYRQNSDFFYLTGIEQEKSVLMICNNADVKELQQVLFILKPDKDLEIWEGKKLTKGEAQKISGIKTVKYLEDLEMILHSLICTNHNIYFNTLELPKFKSEVSSRDDDNLSKIKQQYPTHSYQRLAPILQELRLVKSNEEVEIIRKSCSITKDAFLRVLKSVRPDRKEYEIEAEISYEFIRNGASGHAYAPIIAGGINACSLHYLENDCVLKGGDLLLMDFGAEYANYSADLSRTIPINGKFTPRQREAYEATLRVFKFARNLMIPGTTINKFHKKVCRKWEEEHMRLGLYSQKDIENNESENPLWFKYFMHGTSHFLGLDVHDVGTRDTEFKPGMILTCEPGLYIPEEGFGIRIENDILITEDGNIDLMEDIPIEAEDIEHLMKS